MTVYYRQGLSVFRILIVAALTLIGFAMGMMVLFLLLTDGFGHDDSAFDRIMTMLGLFLFILGPPVIIYKKGKAFDPRLFIEVNDKGIVYPGWPWKRIDWADIACFETFSAHSQRHLRIFLIDAERFHREHPHAAHYGAHGNQPLEVTSSSGGNLRTHSNDHIDGNKKMVSAEPKQTIMADLSFISGSMAGLERALAKAAAHHVPHRTISISGI